MQTNKLKKTILFLSICSGLVFNSCGSTNQNTTNTNPHAKPHIEMHQEFINEETQKEETNTIIDSRLHNVWSITKVENLNVNPENFKEKHPRLELDTTNFKVFGHDGCNAFQGSFTLNKNTITFGQLAETMKMCFENTEISSKITMLLSGKELTYSFENNHLFFYKNDKKIMTLKPID